MPSYNKWKKNYVTHIGENVKNAAVNWNLNQDGDEIADSGLFPDRT